eukprot:TRINITY_DN14580_c0_g1_i1.p1 TRINITY_DN14580_c0_g1~~TRINITY_DN14580_c0_g1_i1.p1  ORF type:complete len:541 (-),score=70.36 TRINITY_DN14580_c0_g1_i1:74-1696(-)
MKFLKDFCEYAGMKYSRREALSWFKACSNGKGRLDYVAFKKFFLSAIASRAEADGSLVERKNIPKKKSPRQAVSLTTSLTAQVFMEKKRELEESGEQRRPSTIQIGSAGKSPSVTLPPRPKKQLFADDFIDDMRRLKELRAKATAKGNLRSTDTGYEIYDDPQALGHLNGEYGRTSTKYATMPGTDFAKMYSSAPILTLTGMNNNNNHDATPISVSAETSSGSLIIPRDPNSVSPSMRRQYDTLPTFSNDTKPSGKLSVENIFPQEIVPPSHEQYDTLPTFSNTQPAAKHSTGTLFTQEITSPVRRQYDTLPTFDDDTQPAAKHSTEILFAHEILPPAHMQYDTLPTFDSDAQPTQTRIPFEEQPQHQPNVRYGAIGSGDATTPQYADQKPLYGAMTQYQHPSLENLMVHKPLDTRYRTLSQPNASAPQVASNVGVSEIYTLGAISLNSNKPAPSNDTPPKQENLGATMYQSMLPDDLFDGVDVEAEHIVATPPPSAAATIPQREATQYSSIGKGQSVPHDPMANTNSNLIGMYDFVGDD